MPRGIKSYIGTIMVSVPVLGRPRTGSLEMDNRLLLRKAGLNQSTLDSLDPTAKARVERILALINKAKGPSFADLRLDDNARKALIVSLRRDSND